MVADTCTANTQNPICPSYPKCSSFLGHDCLQRHQIKYSDVKSRSYAWPRRSKTINRAQQIFCFTALAVTQHSFFRAASWWNHEEPALWGVLPNALSPAMLDLLGQGLPLECVTTLCHGTDWAGTGKPSSSPEPREVTPSCAVIVSLLLMSMFAASWNIPNYILYVTPKVQLHPMVQFHVPLELVNT